MTETPNSNRDCGPTLALLLLRVWLGVRAIATGIEKFSDSRTLQVPLLDAAGKPDSSGAVVEVTQKFYSLHSYHAIPDSMKDKFAQEPFLPAFLTAPYYGILGWALIALGIGVLLGIFTRASLFLMGLLYVSLTFGLILIKQDAGVSWLAIHVAMIAVALSLCRHNRFALTCS
jgi:thiosulfate dehydrogenase [quinone] large subunit